MSEESSAKNDKRWRVGTLSYTTAGLVALFFWLILGDFAIPLIASSYFISFGITYFIGSLADRKCREAFICTSVGLEAKEHEAEHLIDAANNDPSIRLNHT